MALAVVACGVVFALVWNRGSTDAVPARPTVARPGADADRRKAVVAVAGAWLDRTAAPADVATAKRRAGLVDTFAAPVARDRIADQLAETAGAFSGDDVAGLALQSVPIGYRVGSVTADRAVVQTQQVVLQASPGTATVGLLATGRIVLAESGGHWRVRDASVDATPLDAVSRDALAALQTYSSFRHVP